MGYNTTYRGALKVECSLTGLKRLKSILGEDVRDIKELAKYKGRYDPKDAYWHHIDLVLDDNFDLVWDDGAEKSYICPDMIMSIVSYVKEVDPSFKINGTFDAYGEEPGDIWKLVCTGEDARRADPKEEKARIEAAFKELLEAVDDVLDHFAEGSRVCQAGLPSVAVRLELAKRAVKEIL